MSKLYSGGILLGTGFKVEDDTLLDDRGAVVSKSSLDHLRKAKGQLTFVEENKSLYIYEGNGYWRPINSSRLALELPESAEIGDVVILTSDGTGNGEPVSTHMWIGSGWLMLGGGSVVNHEFGFMNEEF